VEGAVPAAQVFDPPIAVLEEDPCVTTGNDSRTVPLQRDGRARISSDYRVGGVHPISPVRGLIEEFDMRHEQGAKTEQQ
jgi:hypothetical protein